MSGACVWHAANDPLQSSGLPDRTLDTGAALGLA
jgi:hypothetical protein